MQKPLPTLENSIKISDIAGQHLCESLRRKKKDKIDIKQNACPTDFMNYFSWNAMNKVYKYQYYSSILLWLTLAVRSQKTCMCEHPNFG